LNVVTNPERIKFWIKEAEDAIHPIGSKLDEDEKATDPCSNERDDISKRSAGEKVDEEGGQGDDAECRKVWLEEEGKPHESDKEKERQEHLSVELDALSILAPSRRLLCAAAMSSKPRCEVERDGYLRKFSRLDGDRTKRNPSCCAFRSYPDAGDNHGEEKSNREEKRRRREDAKPSKGENVCQRSTDETNRGTKDKLLCDIEEGISILLLRDP